MVFLHELISHPTERFPSCHCSSIVELPGGDLMACWYSGSGEARPDVAVVASRKPKDAAKWSEPVVLADEPGKPEGNCIFFIMPDGVLWLIYGTMMGKLDGPAGPGVRWETCDLRYRTSTDCGITWSEIRWLDRELGNVVRTKPIVMDNGEVIFGVEYKDSHSRFWITPDCGKTWQRTGPLMGILNEQPSIIQRGDGSLFAMVRPSFDSFILQTESKDRGRTWSFAGFTGLPNPYVSIDMVKLRDGRVVLAFNNSPKERSPFTLALSEDEGRTWPWKRDLITEPGEFSYPAIIQASDGTVHVTYTHLRKSIGHFQLSPDWVKGRK
ncbi:MAG TPA: exo-alpha-sialidase [Candidatus Brocadiia bacterium]|nr:exo-alpha-sialidase [Candidatus Brocadiia bacterium]